MIRDMTAALQNPAISWDGALSDIAVHFEPWVDRVKHGLYVQYFQNDAPLPVFDKNREFARGGDGALVIHAHGASLKPGKFQGGFLRRRQQDADHLHRTRADPFGRTYRECLTFCLLLDLRGEPRGPFLTVKDAEGLLKRKIDQILRARELLHATATRRGDWRRLRSGLLMDDLKSWMHAALVEVAQEWLGSVQAAGS